MLCARSRCAQRCTVLHTTANHSQNLEPQLTCSWIAPLVLIGWYVLLNVINIAALTILPPPPAPPPAPPIQEEDYILKHAPRGSSRRSLPGLTPRGAGGRTPRESSLRRSISNSGAARDADESGGHAASESTDEVRLEMPPTVREGESAHDGALSTVRFCIC